MNDITTYQNKHYRMQVTQDSDTLRVSKSSNTEWSEITMITNGEANGVIRIRSAEMAAQLRFMLEQLLDT